MWELVDLLPWHVAHPQYLHLETFSTSTLQALPLRPCMCHAALSSPQLKDMLFDYPEIYDIKHKDGTYERPNHKPYAEAFREVFGPKSPIPLVSHGPWAPGKQQQQMLPCPSTQAALRGRHALPQPHGASLPLRITPRVCARALGAARLISSLPALPTAALLPALAQ